MWPNAMVPRFVINIVCFAVRNPEDSKRAMLGMCYILDPDLSLPNKVTAIIIIISVIIIIIPANIILTIITITNGIDSKNLFSLFEDILFSHNSEVWHKHILHISWLFVFPHQILSFQCKSETRRFAKRQDGYEICWSYRKYSSLSWNHQNSQSSMVSLTGI